MLKRLLSLVAFVLVGLGPAAAGEPVLKVTGGKISGVTADGVVSYKGVPFAAPPVGDLRWRPPAAPAKWKGVRKAEAFGPACPQPNREDGGGGGRADKQNEDCLTLNVFTPASAKKGAKLPVMVWIHGGAFRLGSSSFPIYEGGPLASQGVVLVTVNYRVGLLGFFAHPGLTAAAQPDAPLGNYGLMDQVAALKWVQANIAAFGGDPANVTVFGESAGGSSIIYLLTMPAAKGLFAKAIVESGGGTQRPPALAETEKRGLGYVKAMGLPETASLADLRARPAEDWIKAQGALAGGLGFGPFVDGRLVKETPLEAIRDGRAQDVPLIIGANSNEASVLTTLGVNPAAARIALRDKYDEVRKLYGEDLPDAEFLRQVMGDLVFVAPSRWVAQKTASGASTWLYYFSYVATARRGSVPGASHGSEIVYAFGTWRNTPLLARAASEEDKAISTAMSACWVAFAKTGAPSCAGAPTWPAYTASSDQEMEFGSPIAVHAPPKAAAFDLMIEQVVNAPR